MAVVGGLVNLVVAGVLHKESSRSLNVRSAFLHVVGDLLGSVGVLVAAIAVLVGNVVWVDAAVSIFIGVIILVGAARILREAIAIFLEATPAHIDVDELVAELAAIPGVLGVHDLHVWSITPSIHALSCHLLVEDRSISQGCALLEGHKRAAVGPFLHRPQHHPDGNGGVRSQRPPLLPLAGGHDRR